MRLFHKELEAYVVAEGLFDWSDTQGSMFTPRKCGLISFVFEMD